MPDSLLSREKNFRRKERAFKKACQHLVQLEKQLITAKVNYNQNSILPLHYLLKRQLLSGNVQNLILIMSFNPTKNSFNIP